MAADSNKTRASGFELLRILMMLQVVFLHICTKGGYKEMALAAGGAEELVYWLSYLMSRCPVYVFMALTGYFLCNREPSFESSLQKAKKTHLAMLFYSLPVFCIAIPVASRIMPQLFSHGALYYIFNGLFPALSATWYYMTNFLLVLLVAPVIVKGLKDINRRAYSIIVAAMFSALCVWPLLCELEPFSQVFSMKLVAQTEGGKSFYCFIFVFVLGGYLGRYGKSFCIPKHASAISYIALGLANTALLYLWQPWKDVVVFNNNPFALLQAVMLVLFFERLDFSSKSINMAASVCMDVYMLHWMPGVREVVFDIVNVKRFGSGLSVKFWVCAVGSCMAVYVICGCVGLLRQWIFGRLEGLLHNSPKINKVNNGG